MPSVDKTITKHFDMSDTMDRKHLLTTFKKILKQDYDMMEVAAHTFVAVESGVPPSSPSLKAYKNQAGQIARKEDLRRKLQDKLNNKHKNQ